MIANNQGQANVCNRICHVQTWLGDSKEVLTVDWCTAHPLCDLHARVSLDDCKKNTILYNTVLKLHTRMTHAVATDL